MGAGRLSLGDTEILAVTDRGNAELKSAGTSLSARELEILVLVDGRATVAQITKSARGFTAAEVIEVLEGLLRQKLITAADEPSAFESGFLSISVPADFFKHAPGAEPEAETGVASLKQKGYYVRIARRAAQEREVKQGWQATILVVDDDPDLLKLIRTFFRFEGFTVREATKRAEIMAAFRQPPMPDLVLLDVNLPDADGFEVLARLRQHAVLKTVPVVMITAEATREAVLKGLQAGADGYITKPFEPDWVVTAVRQVLGITRAQPGSGELPPG
jgi:CheY-like chemotaxis protein